MVSLKGKEIASSCGRFGVRYGVSDPALQIFLRISLNSVDHVCVSHSVMSSSVTPGTVACQAPLSLGFSRQEHWSGLPCPSSYGPYPLKNIFLFLFFFIFIFFSAQGWSTGKTQRDGMGREAGGGIGMGSTCKSMADSCQCMAKTTTIL